MILGAKMQIFHKDSFNKIIWKVRYVGRWAPSMPVPEAGNIITEVNIVFYVVKTHTFCLANIDAYFHVL